MRLGMVETSHVSRLAFHVFQVVLDGEIAVPCSPQSAIAGSNSTSENRYFGSRSMSMQC